MKKISIYLMAVCLSLSFSRLLSNAAVATVTTSATYSDSIEANNLMQRLTEIKNMDKSNLSSEDKKALRKEVRSLKKEMRSNGSYIYISVGAAIIIVLLLILIL